VRAAHERLGAHLRARLSALPGAQLCGGDSREGFLALASVATTADPGEVARLLEERGVLCRPGLQCAPRAHRTLGSWPRGLLRFSLSHGNTEAEIDAAVAALCEVLASGPAGAGS
jgi:selenocysteine lyase/cysteine desulfurase